MLAVINQHTLARTITNSEMGTGVSIPILPGAMSQYKEYHQWETLCLPKPHMRKRWLWDFGRGVFVEQVCEFDANVDVDHFRSNDE